MIIIELTYQQPLSVVTQYLPQHRAFLDTYYQTGLLLASGPKQPRQGGIILVNSQDEAMVQTIIQQDPFYQQNIANYRLICFQANRYQAALSSLLID